MLRPDKILIKYLILFLMLVFVDSQALETSGYVGLESTYFNQEPFDNRQDYNLNLSLVLEPEFVHEWDDGQQLLAFKPFYRVDQKDSSRTHFDVRELMYEYYARNWELRLGVGKVFWGVTEFQHLVDIVNQTDLVENIDTEDKLGQPMINLALVQDFGTINLFVLPYFRERTFPGRQGRLRTQPPVNTDLTRFESGAEEHHVDFAIRYSHYFGDWDVGLSHFYGTSRDPRFFPAAVGPGQIELVPFYDIINQTSLDLQTTKGNWLWKLEALHRSGQGETYNALAAGFEYTFVGAIGKADIGVLAEYHYDDRGKSLLTPFDDDIGIGSRIAFNDSQSSELLAGLIIDRETGGINMNLEASRRLGDSFLLELEARAFTGQSRSDPVFLLSRDDYVKFFLSYYY